MTCRQSSQLLMFLVAGAVFTGSLENLAGQDNSGPRLFSTTELIGRLDSPRFDERESATRDLIRVGTTALRPLAKGFIGASPEKAWRIRQICRQISIQGDEAAFYKSAAILKVLFDGPSTTQDLLKLQDLWIASKSERAANELTRLGAEVHLVQDPDQVIAADGGLIDSFADPINQNDADLNANPSGADAQARTIDPDALLEQVELILVSDIETNRKFALGQSDLDNAAAQATQQSLGAEDVLPALDRQIIQLGRQQRVIIVGGNQVFVDNFSYFDPDNSNRVVFGPTWNGDEEGLANLVAVKGIASVEFEGIEVRPEFLETASRVRNLIHLRFTDCTFTTSAVDAMSSVARIEHLTLSKQAIGPALEASLGKLNGLKSVRLDSVTFSPTFWGGFSGCRDLANLELRNIQLSAGDLTAIGEIPGLEQLQLIWTKFPLEEFQHFARKHPQVRPVVVNRAFLGVRGGSAIGDPDEGPCTITEVIPDSAADRGGVEIGDIVEQVNDYPVAAFRELVQYIANFDPGDTVNLKILRDGRRVDLKVTLAERPEDAR